MFLSPFKQDLLKVISLFVLCALVGFAVNIFSRAPVPLRYASPSERLDSTVAKLQMSSISANDIDSDVTLTEISDYSVHKSAIILDARPEIFFNAGHIPSAISLPRDDFEAHYKSLQGMLTAIRDKNFVIYCSGGDCRDSLMVAGALQKLGYSHVRVFLGGWSAWKNAVLPVERANE